MFSLAKKYAAAGMSAYAELQQVRRRHRAAAARARCCGPRTRAAAPPQPAAQPSPAQLTRPLPSPPSPLQAEIAAEKDGYRATRHQAFVGTGYFDELAQTVARGSASTCALTGSTEEDQF
jgi:isocitrate lyase